MAFTFTNPRYSTPTSGVGYVPHYPFSLNLSLSVIDPDTRIQPVFIQPFYLPPDLILDALSTKRFLFECRFAPSELDGISSLANASPQIVSETVNNGSVWFERESELVKINEDGFTGLSESLASYRPDSEFEDYPDAVAQWPCGVNYIRNELLEGDEQVTQFSVSFQLSGLPSMGQGLDLSGQHFWFLLPFIGASASVFSPSESISFSSSHIDINGQRFGTPSPGFPVVKIESVEYY